MLAEERNLPATAIAAHEDFTRSTARADLVSLIEADVRLHRELIGALANPYIGSAHSLLINETRLCLAQIQHRHLLDPTIINEEHSRILHAIQTGNPAQARQYGTDHLVNAEIRLVEHLAEVSAKT
ncbi:FCD domain-containing protein [Rhodococcus sp. Leaf278]|uniref:FCD domain-containing protein n=1 Tax=Rhodococcus sp. Leaf278 TaxID=1736319 RepID=UPI001F3B1658|nr:FCD domain-containing protein [Rhodococcus sp. Leaf278]